MNQRQINLTLISTDYAHQNTKLKELSQYLTQMYECNSEIFFKYSQRPNQLPIQANTTLHNILKGKNQNDLTLYVSRQLSKLHPANKKSDVCCIIF